MIDSEEIKVPGAEPKLNVVEPSTETTQDMKSLSEWAEFSFLIHKLDGDYAENLDIPMEFWPENSKPIEP
jgi:hypothetical protein